MCITLLFLLTLHISTLYLCCFFPKMSERFAECQDFIQLQEHEFFHLKLQCSLDSKVELH